MEPAPAAAVEEELVTPLDSDVTLPAAVTAAVGRAKELVVVAAAARGVMVEVAGVDAFSENPEPNPAPPAVPPKLGAAAVPPKLGAAAVPPNPGAVAVPPKLGAAAVPPKLGAAAVPPKLGAVAVPPKLGTAAAVLVLGAPKLKLMTRYLHDF